MDESEEEEDGPPTKETKKMKKLIRNLEKNTAYESDEDSNPYASSVSVHVYISPRARIFMYFRTRRKRRNLL